MHSVLERGYVTSTDEEPGTPGSVGLGLGYAQFSPYAHLSCPQPRDPQALCLHSFMDEQEALEACQEEWAAISKKKIKNGDKQAMAQRCVLLLALGQRAAAGAAATAAAAAECWSSRKLFTFRQMYSLIAVDDASMHMLPAWLRGPQAPPATTTAAETVHAGSTSYTRRTCLVKQYVQAAFSIGAADASTDQSKSN